MFPAEPAYSVMTQLQSFAFPYTHQVQVKAEEEKLGLAVGVRLCMLLRVCAPAIVMNTAITASEDCLMIACGQ